MIFNILVEDPEIKWVQFIDERHNEAAKEALLSHSAAMLSTDTSIFPTKLVFDNYTAPPLAYGMYADYIGTHVREKTALSLEEAVKKATYLPAQMLGLKDRGIIIPGAFADLA